LLQQLVVNSRFCSGSADNADQTGIDASILQQKFGSGIQRFSID
jgi:hypothetical protein